MRNSIEPTTLVGWIAITVLCASCAYDGLTLRAAHDLECASSKLEVVRDDGRVVVSGCGKRSSYFCQLDGVGIERCSREKPAMEGDVQRAANTDFACPVSDVFVTPASDGSFIAEGCGKRARYACQEAASGWQCQQRSAPAKGSVH